LNTVEFYIFYEIYINMSTSWLLVVGIVSIALVFYYFKYTESQVKIVELLSKNHLLDIENQKLKTKVKYLHNYKNDVSKTFKILDNELKIIKKNIPESDHYESHNECLC
jgi:hypothetical protein